MIMSNVNEEKNTEENISDEKIKEFINELDKYIKEEKESN